MTTRITAPSGGMSQRALNTLLCKKRFSSTNGLEVMGISSNLGTYGMGGPGFFGLQLENS